VGHQGDHVTAQLLRRHSAQGAYMWEIIWVKERTSEEGAIQSVRKSSQTW
jgi:hypothetical protein